MSGMHQINNIFVVTDKMDYKEIENLNTRLTSLEENIYNRTKEQNQVALKNLLDGENGIYDYEIEVELGFFIQEDELISWRERMCKSYFLEDTRYWNINDKNNHNTTSCCWKHKELNEQKHCWLLHRLYDDFRISWKDIVKIETICFDINVLYQYKDEIN